VSDEKKRRFAVGRKSIVDDFYLDYSQVFYDLERAITFAKARNKNVWSVFELHLIRATEPKATQIILPYAIVCEAQRSGAIDEIIYDTHNNGRAAIEGRVNQNDQIYYMMVIDYAGKQEEKEDFVVAFYPYEGEWRYEWKSHDTGQKAGWNGDEYLVKIQLPVNREVPREQR